MEIEILTEVRNKETGELIIRDRYFSVESMEEDIYKIENAVKKVEEQEKWKCPECGEVRIDDARVEVGMKCGNCSY